MVNALVNRFADVHRENPARPLVYAPGAGITLTASDVWDLHRRYADDLGSLGLDSRSVDRLRGWKSHRQRVSAAGVQGYGNRGHAR